MLNDKANHGSETPAAIVSVPTLPRLSHLPLIIRPVMTLARRGRAVFGLTGDVESVRRFTAILLAFGLPEDAAVMTGAPAVPALPLPRAEEIEAAMILQALPLFPTQAEATAFVAALPDEGGLAGEPKDPIGSEIFRLFALLADPVRIETLRLRFISGISWQDARGALVGQILRVTAEAGRNFARFAEEADALDDLLAHGAERAAGRLPA